jgi:predicted RNA-binding protein
MSQSALERFHSEFRRWIQSHNSTHGFETDSEALVPTLEARIPREYLTGIGSAFVNGWLVTESSPGRGYFVRESDRPGVGGGQFTLIHRGDSVVQPCWELYIQLADYAWLRTVAGRSGHHVRLEDNLMDLTVRAGATLLLYVEQKERKETAQQLLRKVMEYGRLGFGLDEDDRGNDPLRKAKYLVREDTRPLYVGLSAIGYRQLFRVEYLKDNHFALHREDEPFANVLTRHAASGTTEPPPWSPIDALAIEIQRVCSTCWVSVGSGKTAYNFYAHGEAIVVSIDKDGFVWTDSKRLGKERASRLSAALAQSGIGFASDKAWSYWTRAGKRVHAQDLDPINVAVAVQAAIG